MVRKIVILAFAAIAIVLLVGPSVASLIPLSWGFPVMVQNQTLSATNMDFATARDLQTANIAFPTVATSVLGTTFPTIMQNADQSQTAMKLNTMDQTASTMFAYPWLSIGGSPVPSMGFL